ncbi:hypothetical protein [Microbacterium sp. NPDC096154]|uniref:hypothetical protein n=1 Tax=Microbacterium sp. NPDC096154 TaxID=3155549 RepID=UPI00332A2A6E
MAESASTRKVQITVPVADVSVIEWLGMQHSASESVRRLIRESVEREGFVDVANRPVKPLSAVPEPVAVPDARAAALEPAPVAPVQSPAEEPPMPAPTRRSHAAAQAASAAIDDLLGL